MFDLLRMGYYRLRRPKTVADAAKQLISPSLVERIQEDNIGSSDLLSLIAEREGFKIEVLVEEVARRLGIPSQLEVSLPSAGLIAGSGYSTESLLHYNVIPQICRQAAAGYALAAADPSVLDCEGWLRRGVEIVLAPGRSIREAWEHYLRVSAGGPKFNGNTSVGISQEQVFAVIHRLVLDAASLGAAEVFLGHPDQESYEFLAGERRYCGALHKKVFELILQKCQEKKQWTKSLGVEEPWHCVFALTHNSCHPVIYLSWEKKNLIHLCPEQVHKPQVKGSVELPKQQVNGRKEAAVQTKHHQEDLEPKEEHCPVLLVDDDSRFVNLLKRVLVRVGYDVTVVENGEVALKLLEEGRFNPRLVICDMHMPKVDGSMFLQIIAEYRADLPVLILTSDDDSQLEADLVSMGAAAFVRKQEDARILLAWCRNLTRQKRFH